MPKRKNKVKLRFQEEKKEIEPQDSGFIPKLMQFDSADFYLQLESRRGRSNSEARDISPVKKGSLRMDTWRVKNPLVSRSLLPTANRFDSADHEMGGLKI